MQDADVNYVAISDKIINNPINSLKGFTAFGSANGETFGVVLGALIALIIIFCIFLFVWKRFIRK